MAAKASWHWNYVTVTQCSRLRGGFAVTEFTFESLTDKNSCVVVRHCAKSQPHCNPCLCHVPKLLRIRCKFLPQKSAEISRKRISEEKTPEHWNPLVYPTEF